MTAEQATELLGQIETLGKLVTGLYALVAVVAIYLGWSLHRLARNQVAEAELLRQGVAKIEGDLPAKE